MAVRSYRRWTEAELALLRRYYSIAGVRTVQAALSGIGSDFRTDAQIRSKATNLGLRRNGQARRSRPPKAPTAPATIPINRTPQEVFAEADVDSLLRMAGSLQTSMVEAVHDLTGFIDRHGAVLEKLRNRNRAATVTGCRNTWLTLVG